MRRHSLKSGFTLTEVLVVVVILALLVSILMAFGRRLKEQANEKLCKSTIQILVASIELYYDYHSEFPDFDPLLMATNDNYAIERLYGRLHSLTTSRKLCEQIQASQIGDTDIDLTMLPAVVPAPDGKLEFLDPWGNALDYQKGIFDFASVPPQYVTVWTFPRVTSGGPDGVFNTADDISSK